MRFLFCSLTSPGYLNPAIGLAMKLREWGHEVAFVSDLEAEAPLRQQRLRRLPRSDESHAAFYVSRWSGSGEIVLQFKHILGAVREFRPDVMVGQHLTMGAFMVREMFSIPLAVIGLASYLWPATRHDPIGCRRDGTRQWRYDESLRICNEAKALFGGRPISSDQQNLFLGDLYLLRTIPELVEEGDDLPSCVHLVGSCLWEEQDAVNSTLNEWLEAAVQSGAPIVYAQQGRLFSEHEFWQSIVEVSRDSGPFVAASTGRMNQPVGELPPSVFARSYVPQGRVLRYARAMIGSANTTAVLGALTAGVPSLLIPSGGEQYDLSRICTSAGVAMELDLKKASPETLKDAITVLLSDNERAFNARRIANAFRRRDSFDAACKLLVELAQQKTPVRRSDCDALAEARGA